MFEFSDTTEHRYRDVPSFSAMSTVPRSLGIEPRRTRPARLSTIRSAHAAGLSRVIREHSERMHL